MSSWSCLCESAINKLPNYLFVLLLLRVCVEIGLRLMPRMAQVFFN